MVGSRLMARETETSTGPSPTAAETRQQLDTQKDRLLEVIQNAVIEEHQIRTRLEQAVEDLRVLRLATWDEIGQAIGISGQAAYQRYGKKPMRRR